MRFTKNISLVHFKEKWDRKLQKITYNIPPRTGLRKRRILRGKIERKNGEKKKRKSEERYEEKKEDE